MPLAFLGRIACAAFLVLATSEAGACVSSDPPVPWDTTQVVLELNSELQPRGPDFHLHQVEVLGYKTEKSNQGGLVQIVLLWGRMGTDKSPARWALVQGFRHPSGDARWRLSVWFRNLKAPLTRLRPGEQTDGTWDAFHRYDRPPTAEEVCAFAAVDFLTPSTHDGWRRISGGWRAGAWARRVGDRPSCALPS